MTSLTRDKFIEEMVKELKLSPSGNFDLPRQPTILMTLSEAVEELSYDWPEVHMDVLKMISDFLYNIPNDNSKNNIKNLQLYSNINITTSIFEGLMSCTILDENDKKDGKGYRSNICAHLFFTLPYKILMEVKRNYDNKKNIKNMKILKNIFHTWNLNIEDDHSKKNTQDNNTIDDVIASIVRTVRVLLKQGVIAVQENMITSSTWKKMNVTNTLCNLFLLLCMSTNIASSQKSNDDKHDVEIINDVTLLIREHCTIDATNIPNVIEILIPYLDHPEVSIHVLPLLGQVVSNENFIMKKSKSNSGKKYYKKSTMNTMIISQVLKKIELDHLKKIQVVMKQYILKDTPLEMFPIFIGAVSLCKFIVTYVDLYSNNNNNNNNSTMPNPLIQSGIIQHFITLCVGNKKKKMKKKQNQKSDNDNNNNSSTINETLFSKPSWIISHNFMLWYILNDYTFAKYIVKVSVFVNLIRHEVYKSNKPIDAMFWEIGFCFGRYLNHDDEKTGEISCNDVIALLNNKFALELNMTVEKAQHLYLFLERLITSKLLIYCNTAVNTTSVPPLLIEFKKYCFKLQKIIAKRQLDFFSMEKKEQLVKKENNNFKDGSNEEDEREKEIEKITTLRSKFTKLFKNFLDNKDA